ncbi:uncharacterized protein LOC122849689 [Aphidius gifuensis]|uniref:uncharacterized protein LOC122849689 n=1 Tax=Aphidius gifuensis TaxID=684658 RepID=UPI001CDD5C95|nr:uncharacterized protein LOC122849689 [Aphidius gifuensis]
MNITFFLTCCFLLCIEFHWTTCDIQEEQFDELDNVTSIKVQLGISDKKIIQCIFETWNHKDDTQSPFESFELYDENKSFIRNDWLKFIGHKDNSCSFIIIPELLKNIYHKDSLGGRWAIKEMYCIPTSFQTFFGTCKKHEYVTSYTIRHPSY